jgi:thiamine biosynthesis lipoprotein
MAHACDSIRRARPLLGTFVEIAIADEPQDDLDAAFEAAFAAVAKVHELMSFHDVNSDVSRLNRKASEHPVMVDAWTYQVLQDALDLHQRSAGLFDITIAPVLQDMGLLPGARDRRSSTSKKIVMAEAVELLPGRRVRFLRPDTAIDLGGIAKGFAVDRAVDTLKGGGVSCGLVNAGGDLVAFGPHPQPAHVRDPRDPGQCICRIDLTGEALASSGIGFGSLGSVNTSNSAIIDPRSCRPVTDIAGATTRAPSCWIADALTKIVMIAGADASALLDHYNASALIVLPDGDVRVSPNWKGVALAA